MTQDVHELILYRYLAVFYSRPTHNLLTYLLTHHVYARFDVENLQ